MLSFFSSPCAEFPLVLFAGNGGLCARGDGPDHFPNRSLWVPALARVSTRTSSSIKTDGDSKNESLHQYIKGSACLRRNRNQPDSPISQGSVLAERRFLEKLRMIHLCDIILSLRLIYYFLSSDMIYEHKSSPTEKSSAGLLCSSARRMLCQIACLGGFFAENPCTIMRYCPTV